MRASAHLAVERVEAPAGVRTRITRLRSDPPLVLRPISRGEAEPLQRWDLASLGPARVAIAAGAAGPLGGDDLRLGITVGPNAALVVRTVSATLLLPGARGQPSRTEVTAHVGENAVLVWLPGPVIAARGCDHQGTIRVALARGARLLLREVLLLGRYAEVPGTIHQRLRVELDGRPLHDQEVAIGHDTPGWDGPAVTGGRRAVGSILVVDSAWDDDPLSVPSRPPSEELAFMPLARSAVLVSALTHDGLRLGRLLDSALVALGRPIAVDSTLATAARGQPEVVPSAGGP